MPDPDEKSLPREVDARTEARSFMASRHHVGAAGFAQANVLEQIITAGREQIELIRSLRQVVAATQAQLQGLPPLGAADDQVDVLKDIVHEGQAQIRAAEDLRRSIQRTLAEVRDTPVEEVSAKVLKTLGEVVWQQAADLENLIAAAITEASTTEQVMNLERVSVEAQTRLENAEHEQVERDLAHLDLLGRQALEHIRTLEANGQTHAMQRAQLEQEAEVAQRSISALEVAQTEDLEELGQMAQQREASRARIAALEAASRETAVQMKASRRENNPSELDH